MPEPFDAYYAWLGIPPGEQPPHAYRLLGVRLFENDLDVIRTAADRQMTHLRTYQLGEHSERSQRLLNEVAAARAQLTDPKKKALYDRRLAMQFEASTPAAQLPVGIEQVDLSDIDAEMPRAKFVARRPPKKTLPWRILAAVSGAVVVVIILVLVGRAIVARSLAPAPAGPPLDDALAEATETALRGDSHEALEVLRRYMTGARGENWTRGQRALAELTEAVSTSKAMEFWSRFDATELADFREKGRLPESLWLDSWGVPLQTPGFDAVWRATLQRTLPEAVARAESLPEPVVLMTGLLDAEDWPNPTEPTAPEQVAAEPEAWRDKLVYFKGVRIDGEVVMDRDYGFLLRMTSAAGVVYPAQARGGKLIVVVPADLARQLKPLLAGKDYVPARLYCRIEAAQRMALEGLRMFPKAIVYKMEVYLP